MIHNGKRAFQRGRLRILATTSSVASESTTSTTVPSARLGTSMCMGPLGRDELTRGCVYPAARQRDEQRGHDLGFELPFDGEFGLPEGIQGDGGTEHSLVAGCVERDFAHDHGPRAVGFVQPHKDPLCGEELHHLFLARQHHELGAVAGCTDGDVVVLICRPGHGHLNQRTDETMQGGNCGTVGRRAGRKAVAQIDRALDPGAGRGLPIRPEHRKARRCDARPHLELQPPRRAAVERCLRAKLHHDIEGASEGESHGRIRRELDREAAELVDFGLAGTLFSLPGADRKPSFLESALRE